MPTPRKFRMWMQKRSTGEFYTVSGNSIVMSSTPYYLKYTPDGWKETQITYSRSITNHGVIRSSSEPFSFVKDGAKIARHVSYTQGTEGDCILGIDKFRSLDWLHQPWYSGLLNFFTMDDTLTAAKVAVVDGDLESIIKAKETTKYQIPIQTADCLQVYMSGINLLASNKFVTFAADGAENAHTPTLGDGITLIPLSPAGTDNGDYTVGETNLIIPQVGWNLNDASAAYKATRDADVTFTFSGDIGYQVTPGNSYPGQLVIEILIFRNNDYSININLGTAVMYQDPNPIAVGTSTTRTINFSYNYSLLQGDTFIVVAYNYEYGNPSERSYNPNTIHFTDGGTFEVASTFQLPDKTIRGYYWHQVFEKLVDKMTDGQYAGHSDFFQSLAALYDSVPQHQVLTCGDALRELYVDTAGNTVDPTITITLADMRADAQAYAPLGLGVVNNVLRIELLSFWYDKDYMIADLGEVDWPEITVATDYLYTTYKAGYANETYDALNGRDEYNNGQVWTLPLTSPGDKAYDGTSPIRWDMYGQMQVIANLTNKTTTDADSDNDTFGFEISAVEHSTGVKQLARPNTTANTSGMLFAGTAYNVMRTPKHNLLRNGSVLRMMCHLRDGQNITLQSADKNTNVVADLGSGAIVEKDPIAIAGLPTPPFWPRLFNVKVSLEDIVERMAINPRGYFKATSRGKTFKGFTSDISGKPATLDKQDFKLLFHPDTNFSDYII